MEGWRGSAGVTLEMVSQRGESAFFFSSVASTFGVFPQRDPWSPFDESGPKRCCTASSSLRAASHVRFSSVGRAEITQSAVERIRRLELCLA